ncbi:MAG: portal protein [Planctomycetota bacterium]|jgi:hypothetical protein
MTREAPLENAGIDSGYTSEEINTEDMEGTDDWWLARARSAFRASEAWFDSSVRRKVEDNMRMFNSEHPRGSKYHHTAYSKRSKLFRPKIRTATRKLEAAASAAFFATQDAVSCIAPNPGDARQNLSAAIQTGLLNYRLTNNIPWYLTVLGGLQDSSKQGIVISKQSWKYTEIDEVYEETVMSEAGDTLETVRTINKKVINDHPQITLVPIENIRISPAADWTDPANSSPYLIDREPFFVHEILERGGQPEQRGHTAWRKMNTDAIRSSLRNDFDSIRQAREGRREDRYDDVRTDVDAYDVVWVHHNFMRVNGEDWYFDTLGEEFMLSEEPVPASEVFPTTLRPYIIGYSTIETHKPYPAGAVELASPITEESNDITNLRLDAIRHVLSPRYFIRRGQSVDIQSLMKNVPGGVTTMDDPNTDVNIRTVQDPTAGSYQEQDRLDLATDDLLGNFSGASVANNRNMNETVGGMNLLSQGANEITEMTIRILTETWIEKVLQQIMEFEMAYESDEVVLSIVGMQHGVHPKVVFNMLKEPTKPELAQKMDGKEIVTEIFGSLGFKSAERFFPDMFAKEANAETEELKGKIAELEQMIATDQPKIDGAIKVAEIQSTGKQQIEQMRLQAAEKRDNAKMAHLHKIAGNKLKIDMLNYGIKQASNDLDKQRMINEKMALEHQVMMDEVQLEADMRQNIESPTDNNVGKQKEAPDLAGNDKSGVIARNDYGTIPNAAG